MFKGAKVVFMIVIMFMGVAAPASADNCDDAQSQFEEAVKIDEDDVNKRSSAIEQHIKSHGTDGFQEAMCEFWHASIAGFDKLVILRRKAEAVCSGRFPYTCDSACLEKQRAEFVTNAEEECSKAETEDE